MEKNLYIYFGSENNEYLSKLKNKQEEFIKLITILKKQLNG